jgi:signal transduction histidine kinase
VQKVIVSHNGLVTVRNLPEGGAEFRVTLPIGTSSPHADQRSNRGEG